MRFLMLAFISFPGLRNHIRMNGIGVLYRHLGVGERKLRRIGESWHALIPMRAAQHNRIPIAMNIRGHVPEIRDRSIEHPRAATIGSWRMAPVAYKFLVQDFALVNDLLTGSQLRRFGYGRNNYRRCRVGRSRTNLESQ